MSETDPIVVPLATSAHGADARPGTLSRVPRIISFTRAELNLILSAYGRKVAAGEWRDYAIDCLRDRAVFSIFRRSNEMPLYRIVKLPKLARRQGAFQILAPTGLILKRGRDLRHVLKAIDKERRLAAVG